jgi:short-subunit dehydrogenase
MQKNIVVTGGSKGIGKAIVEKFLKEGHFVISISRSIGDLKELIGEYSDSLDCLFYDFSKKEDVMSCSAFITNKYDSIHVLVNNAGVFLPGQIGNEEEGVFELQMALNISAPYYFTRGLLPLIKQKTHNYIFNICSTASIMGYTNGGSYCISKHALLGLSRVLRLELMPYQTNVCAVIPGATYTDSWSGSDLPQSRFMKPENIAEIIYTTWLNREHACVEELLIRPLQGDL